MTQDASATSTSPTPQLGTLITCPSGLSGRIRGFKVKDESTITDARLVRSGQLFSTLLRSVWLETTDPGPYETPAGGRLDWEKAAAADRFYVLIQARIATHGSTYEFRLPCPQDTCRHVILHNVELEAMDLLPMAEEMRETLRSGGTCTTRLRDGRQVRFRAMTGVDDKALTAIQRQNPQDLMTSALLRRIVEIEGVGPHPGAIKDAFENLDGPEADDLRDHIETLEGGYKTDFDLECESCGALVRTVLPLEPGFFSSRRRFSANSTARAGSA